ncbi:MAG: hypothetical protein MUF49_02145 [Oculatellaceae cyanobacterium Prado106]|jgi:hypothetical protein|nr:hypothetical protein [Oculatellaceae cyanobacterium Prado106]
MPATKQRPPASVVVPKLAIDQATSTLQDLPERPKESWSLREAVTILKDSITTALNRGYTYDEISSILASKGVGITASSLKRYLAAAKRQQGEGGVKQTRTRRPRTLKASAAASAPAAKEEAPAAEAAPAKRRGRGPAKAAAAAAPAPKATRAKAEPAAAPARPRGRAAAKAAQPKPTTRAKTTRSTSARTAPTRGRKKST